MLFSFLNSYLPVQGSTFASSVDTLFDFTIWVSVIGFLILIGAMIYFILKYQRRSDNDKTAYITHNSYLEFLWSFIPFCIFMLIFYWGWKIYENTRIFPENALTINVTGKQWAWDVVYPNGRTSTNDVVIPVRTPVVLTLTSVDVIHSFYVPAFRIKQDAVPGKRSKLWFQSDKLGEYEMFCTEFCGTAHSQMIGKVKVVTKAEYDEWLAKDKSKMSLSDLGQELYTSKGCIACHSLDGSVKVGPTWKGLWGTERKFTDGSSANADENYIRSSVLNPAEKYVAGFANVVMPSYQGQLTEEEINQLIEYMKTLK